MSRHCSSRGSARLFFQFFPVAHCASNMSVPGPSSPKLNLAATSSVRSLSLGAVLPVRLSTSSPRSPPRDLILLLIGEGQPGSLGQPNRTLEPPNRPRALASTTFSNRRGKPDAGSVLTPMPG